MVRLVEREREILRLVAEFDPTLRREFRAVFKAMERCAGKNPRLRRLCCDQVTLFANHAEYWVRANVAITLGNIGNAKDYRTLCTLTRDDHHIVRAEAYEAMPACGWRLGLPKILSVLRSDLGSEEEELVKSRAARGLFQYEPDQELVDAVYAIEQTASDLVRCELAFVWFEWFGESQVSRIVQCFASDDYYCYMRPCWNWHKEPEAWMGMSTPALEELRLGVDVLVAELEEGDCPSLHIEENSAWSAEIGAVLAERA